MSYSFGFDEKIVEMQNLWEIHHECLYWIGTKFWVAGVELESLPDVESDYKSIHSLKAL